MEKTVIFWKTFPSTSHLALPMCFSRAQNPLYLVRRKVIILPFLRWCLIAGIQFPIGAFLWVDPDQDY